ATGLPSGTIYPILARLERIGWVDSDWEDPDAHIAEGRPRRRYYRLTRAGEEERRPGMADTRAWHQWGRRMTKPAKAIAAANAVISDRYATAAAIAAREATRAASMAVQPSRVQ